MQERVFCTNDRCVECDGFITFEIRDVDQDGNVNTILSVWVYEGDKEKTL